MKLNAKPFAILLIAAAIVCLSSAFVPGPGAPHPGGENYNKDYFAVQRFVQEQICSVLAQDLDAKAGGGINVHAFSRCPSGFQPVITTKSDSVLKDHFVNGKILRFAGCSSSYVCHFKVCVEKGFVMLRSSGGSYLSVSAWIAQRNAKAAQPIVKH